MANTELLGGTNRSDLLELHDKLRVTFAQNRSGWIPDVIEEADFRDNLAHLVDYLAGLDFSLVPASSVTVPPGFTTVTIDFMLPGAGAITVGQALEQLNEGLYGPLDFARQTYIRSAERVAASPTTWGDAPPDAPPDEQCDLACMLKRAGGTIVVVGALAAVVTFWPEITGAARTAARRFNSRNGRAS